MTDHLLGQANSLATAITWALALVLSKQSRERIGPVGLNLFKSTVGLILLGATLVVLCAQGLDVGDALRQISRRRLATGRT